MLRSVRYGGTAESYANAGLSATHNNRYVHLSKGGGGAGHDYVLDGTPLVLWEGRGTFSRHALEVELHPSLGVERMPLCASQTLFATHTHTGQQPSYAHSHVSPHAHVHTCASPR